MTDSPQTSNDTPKQPPADIPSGDDLWEDHHHHSSSSSSSAAPMLCCSFNQDGGCLAVGTSNGFAIHNVHPHQVSVRRELQGGIGTVEMLFRCNLMALVGGGPSPHAPSYRVLLWDDHVQKAIGELSFRQVVLGVKLRRDAIAVALRDRVYVYHLADLSLRDKIYTADNPHGLLSLSSSSSGGGSSTVQEESHPNIVLACPSVTEGHVRVELYGLRKTVLLEAHESSLRNLLLTSDGTKLATSSVKGTVIRVWDVSNQTCLHEFRRGVERVQMNCLAWSWDHEWLACTSDKGTAHVFHVDLPQPTEGRAVGRVHTTTSRTTTTRRSSPAKSAPLSQRVWNSVSGRNHKLASGKGEEKSVVQVRGIPQPLACAFVPDRPHTLAVVGRDVDGNGVLALSDFSSILHQNHLASDEATRIAYHIVARSSSSSTAADLAARKRWRTPPPGSGVAGVPTGESHGKLYVGERLQVLERQMDDITFAEDEDDANGFVSVSTGTMGTAASKEKQAAASADGTVDAETDPTDDKPSNEADPSTS